MIDKKRWYCIRNMVYVTYVDAKTGEETQVYSCPAEMDNGFEDCKAAWEMCSEVLELKNMIIGPDDTVIIDVKDMCGYQTIFTVSFVAKYDSYAFATPIEPPDDIYRDAFLIAKEFGPESEVSHIGNLLNDLWHKEEEKRKAEYAECIDEDEER